MVTDTTYLADRQQQQQWAAYEHVYKEELQRNNTWVDSVFSKNLYTSQYPIECRCTNNNAECMFVLLLLLLLKSHFWSSEKNATTHRLHKQMLFETQANLNRYNSHKVAGTQKTFACYCCYHLLLFYISVERRLVLLLSAEMFMDGLSFRKTNSFFLRYCRKFARQFEAHSIKWKCATLFLI